MGATVSFCCRPNQRSSCSTKDVITEAKMTLDSIEDKLASAMGTGSSMPPGHRQCTIEITNKSSHYTLRDVSVYIYSGFCALHLPQQIEPSSSGKALFSKTGGTACGAVGVFTYDLYNKSTGQTAGSMAVMFSVPFDYNLYSNWYAVGVFEQSIACNYDLYVQMYYGEGDMFIRKKAGEDIDFKSGPFAIPASMTDTCHPILSLKVEDS